MHTEISFPNLGIYLKNVGKSIDLFGNRDSVLRNSLSERQFCLVFGLLPVKRNGQVRIRKIILIWGLSASLRELSGQDFIM